jgi:hypothetical protein
LKRFWEDIPAELIWNVDEIECNEWADKRVKYGMFVPDWFDKD